jgi:predicted SprT family Zn-dependent metalloprotease
VQYKHHASIELAEKVIDDEQRLLNVLAHEFCHLATFMMDGIANNPHGKEFKAWAAKCTKAFGDSGVNVTTKHSYDIDFKYMWQCTSCGSDYKRHSRSIDPKRHRCGSCKGQLKQTRPIPRQNKSQQPSEYQVFVRENMKLVREENPGISQKEVMRAVAERWAKKKKETGAYAAVADATAVDATLAETTLADATVAETTVVDATLADATSSDATVDETTLADASSSTSSQVSNQVEAETAKVDIVVDEMVDLTLKDQETQ